MKLIKLLFLALLVMSANLVASNALDGVNAQKEEALKYVKNFVTAKELKNWMSQKKDFEILDVREAAEWHAGQIAYKKTLNIPRGVIYAKVKKGFLKPKKTYVVVCRSGHRAILAASVLNRWYKFKNVYVLKGGIKAWIKSAGLINNSMHLGPIQIKLKK